MAREEMIPADAPIAADKLKSVKRIARLLDEEFEIGGFKFGLDPILGMLPVAGDVGSYVISVALILTMLKHGVSGKVVAKMLGNVTLDALIGTIPLFGWIFDFTYKANKRNMMLLEGHYVMGKNKGSATPYIVAVLVVLVIVLALIIYLTVNIFQWLATQLNAM